MCSHHFQPFSPVFLGPLFFFDFFLSFFLFFPPSSELRHRALSDLICLISGLRQDDHWISCSGLRQTCSAFKLAVLISHT